MPKKSAFDNIWNRPSACANMGAPELEVAADRTQARIRAARERVDKLERALDEMQELWAAKMEDKKNYEPRVSTTGP